MSNEESLNFCNSCDGEENDWASTKTSEEPLLCSVITLNCDCNDFGSLVCAAPAASTKSTKELLWVTA